MTAHALEHGSPAWQHAARQARWLSWASLAYMAAEGAIAIAAAVLAGSVALLGLGPRAALATIVLAGGPVPGRGGAAGRLSHYS